FDEDFRFKAIGDLDEHGGGAGVNAEFIRHHELFRDFFLFFVRFPRGAHQLKVILPTMSVLPNYFLQECWFGLETVTVPGSSIMFRFCSRRTFSQSGGHSVPWPDCNHWREA